MKNQILPLIIAFLLLTFSIHIADAQLVDPQYDGEKYSIEVENVNFEITPNQGARFSSLKLEGREILYTVLDSGYSGSTFWPSPQSQWGWPPSNELDTEPYTGGIIGKKIILSSETDEVTNLSFSKTVYADRADTSIMVDYVMINKKNKTQKFAPWELTRVPTGGIVFFPKGDVDISGNLAESVRVIDNYAWYESKNSHGLKFFSDSKGWLAHVDKNRYLFVKVFDDISPKNEAPGESEVELYNGGDYIELENQGVYIPIPPKDSVIWTVKWLVRKLPEDMDVNLGSTALIDYTLSVISR